jgi:hypothetical protein
MITSMLPPAGNETTMVIGPDGKLSAAARVTGEAAAAAISDANNSVRRVGISSPNAAVWRRLALLMLFCGDRNWAGRGIQGSMLDEIQCAAVVSVSHYKHPTG